MVGNDFGFGGFLRRWRMKDLLVMVVLGLMLLGVGCTRAKPLPPTSLSFPTPLIPTPTPTLAPTPSPEPSIAYTVVQGDSLWTIALEFGVTVEELIQANHLVNPDWLAVGQNLVIP
jgi:hypothetical protein